MELILDDYGRSCVEYLCDKDLKKAQLSFVKLLYNAHILHGAPNQRVGAAIPVEPEDEKNWHAGDLIAEPGSEYYSAKKWRRVEFQAQDLNDPDSLWVNEGTENYLWFLQLTQNVWGEYKYRFQSTPDGEFFLNIVENPPAKMRARYSSPTPPPQTVPDKYRDNAFGNGWVTLVRANRKFYREERKMECWTRRVKPKWMIPRPKGTPVLETVMGRMFKTYRVTTVGA